MQLVAFVQQMARAFFRHPLSFCGCLAFFLVGCRYVAFEREIFFKKEYLPNHDMSAAIGFFWTNLHSLQHTGDIA